MTDLLVVSKDLCFGAPSLVLIDVHHNLEVQSWDCRRSLGLDGTFSAVSLTKTSIPLEQELSSPRLFSIPCIRSRELLQKFLMFLGPGSFHRERIATKQQLRSLTELS